MQRPYSRSVPTQPHTHELALGHAPESSFSELLAEQVAHAPWLGLSLVAHAGVFLILMMLPPPQAGKAQTVLQMAAAHQEPDLEKEVTPPPPPETTTPDPQIVDPMLTDTTLDPNSVGDPNATGEASGDEGTANNDSVHPSAFSGDGWNTALGLGDGSSHRLVGGRRHGRGGGGGAATLPTIDAALAWLAKHQDADGKWDADEFMRHDLEGKPCTGPGNAVHDVGVTGLAMLAFLGDGNTLRTGRYHDHLKRAAAWLVAQQQENGLLGMAASHDFVYDHAIATYALSEAYGLSSYRVLRPYLERAVGYLQAHRNPYGAWRYQPRDGDQDLSVTGWCVMALKSAADFGIAVDKNTFALCRTYLDQVTDPATGAAGYTKRGEPSSRHPGEHATRFPVDRNDAMTGVALTCRYFLGDTPAKNPGMNASAARLLTRLPRWEPERGSIDLYAWYYGSYALFQHGGAAWTEWSKALTGALVASQRKDGNSKGSWDPEHDTWGEDGGRVCTTALGVLTLQAYYRYSRVVR